MSTTTTEITVTVPEGAATDTGVEPSQEVTALFTSPGGTELRVKISLFQIGHVIGVGVYPTAMNGTVLRWDNMPLEDPTVIHWNAPHCPGDECGSPCGHDETGQ